MNRVTVAARDETGRITTAFVHTPQEDTDARTRPSDPDLPDITTGHRGKGGRRRQRITDETVQEIITRYRDGYTVPTIAYALNVSADTIKRYLRHAGVELRDDRRGQGATAAADRIAAAGATPRQIRGWAREQGFPVPLAGPVPDAIINAYLTRQHDHPDTEQEHHQP